MPLLLQDHQITVHGLPIRQAFSQKLPAKRKLRRQLGMDLDKPAVLLVGESAWLLQGGAGTASEQALDTRPLCEKGVGTEQSFWAAEVACATPYRLATC